MFREIKRRIIGKPLANWLLADEKMPKWKALAIFSSDALSSVAYGPEQVMLILVLSGLIAYGYMAPIACAILFLLAVVTVSYSQVAKANPGGGGSYAVARENLGETPSLIAAAALLTDYTLTVAVSVSSGTDALVSALPFLIPYEMSIDLFVIFVILMIVNLRGIKEASSVFALPTYAFVAGILMLIASGVYQAMFNSEVLIPPVSTEKEISMFAVFIALRAFANGCSSMTGVEAISNGVQMFKKPAVRNAVLTTVYMSSLLAVMFAGITFLIMHFHLMPKEGVTALSQLAENIFGRGYAYYYIQFTTMLVLYLAANTSYNGLPPLLSILAKDGYAPRYLSSRGDRLSYSNGIVLLSVFAGLLVFFYHGNTEHLISLYAIGVFLSFTIAQAGMVVYWKKHKEENKKWHLNALINASGCLITALVVLIIMITKFTNGAWMVLVFIPIMIYIFKKIKYHYLGVADELKLPKTEFNRARKAIFKRIKNRVIIPLSSPNALVAESIAYAKTISDDIIAVTVAKDEEEALKIQEKWDDWNPGITLVLLHSPYRAVLSTLMSYFNELAKEMNAPEDYLTILIPEFETKKWWHRLLHNQTGWILRTLLLLKTNFIVVTIPFHLRK